MGSCRDPDRRNKPPQVKATSQGRGISALGSCGCGEGGDAESKGRMQASPSAETHAWLPEVGTTRWPASSFRPPAIPGVPGWVQGAGHPRSWGCCGLSASFFSSPVKPGFQFLPTHLVGWARPEEWEPGEGAAWRPAGARSHRQASVFIFLRHLHPALGCLPGRRGEGVGTPSHFPRDRTLPGILRQGGWGTLSLSHEALLSSSKTAPRGPTSGCGRGLVAGRSATSGHPLCSLLTPALGGPSPGGSKSHSSPGVTPKSLARAPTDPETRQRGREIQSRAEKLTTHPPFPGLISKLHASDKAVRLWKAEDFPGFQF